MSRILAIDDAHQPPIPGAAAGIWRSPGDGFVVLDRMKNIASLACPPMIVMSARDPQANEERALKAALKLTFKSR